MVVNPINLSGRIMDSILLWSGSILQKFGTKYFFPDGIDPRGGGGTKDPPPPLLAKILCTRLSEMYTFKIV